MSMTKRWLESIGAFDEDSYEEFVDDYEYYEYQYQQWQEQRRREEEDSDPDDE